MHAPVYLEQSHRKTRVDKQRFYGAIYEFGSAISFLNRPILTRKSENDCRSLRLRGRLAQ